MLRMLRVKPKSFSQRPVPLIAGHFPLTSSPETLIHDL
jgi:hypothetical protein